MRISEIEKMVDEIGEAAFNDNEKAHYLEDILYRKFVNYVVKGFEDPELSQKARAVVMTRFIRFARNCTS